MKVQETYGNSKISTYTSESIKQTIGVAMVMVSDILAIGLKMKFPEIPMEAIGAYIGLTSIGAAALLSKLDSTQESSVDVITKNLYSNYSHQ
jgi:hypothetical protein